MAFKFPFTNYHELNLTWVLDQLKSLFEKSEENVTVIENYNGRLTAVETELPLVEETAQGASQQSASAATLAQQAKSTADTAQENAIQAQGLSGTARQEAQAAQSAADAATQAAQQAQATAQNFDGRITQAENDASQALEASRSFENRVQAAITTANNAAQTATNAQGIATRADQNATRADQNAALALDTLKAQRSELERIGAEQVELITEETENGKTEIENLAQSVLDSIPSDYTALSNLVDKKAPVIINSASGAVASFNDGADNMKIQKLVVNIEPVQAGSGDPSPDNVRPISGWTGAKATRTGKNLLPNISGRRDVTSFFIGQSDGSTYPTHLKAGVTYAISFTTNTGSGFVYMRENGGRDILFGINGGNYTPSSDMDVQMWVYQSGLTLVSNFQLEVGSAATSYEPYTGNQIPITWQSEAGTVYGGTFDIISGKLTVNYIKKAITAFNGVFGAVPTGYCVYAMFSDTNNLNVDSAFAKSNIFTYFSGGRYEAPLFSYGGSNGTTATQAFILPSTVASLKDANAWLANNPTECIFKLDTPIEYAITANELTTLYGTNNVWTDVGSIQSCNYPADTKLYIDGKLAEIQATILENI